MFVCSYDSPIQWRLFLRHIQCLLIGLSDGSTLCSVWGPNCTHTHTHTHHSSTYICIFCRRVSVFKRLRGERRNFSKSRSLITQNYTPWNSYYEMFLFRIVQLYVQKSQLFRRLVISQKEGERKRVKEREAVLNNSSNQAVARVAVHRPRKTCSDEKHSDKYSLVWLYQKKMVFPRFRE